MVNWVIGNVIQVKYWTDILFSLVIHAPIDDFTAGQFAKLKLINKDHHLSKSIQRAYSFVNAPKINDLEFYLSVVPSGKLSPLLHALQPGNTLLITKKAHGLFVIDEIPSCENLWMFATGTAIGPYLSILEQGDGLYRFNNIILVHAVRFVKDLNYLSKMMKLRDDYNGKLYIETIVSREDSKISLIGRIPMLLKNGVLERKVGIQLHVKNSHVMLCGNPNMIRDTQIELMNARKMCKHTKYQLGHITSECYW